jgi:hypothetical protein
MTVAKPKDTKKKLTKRQKHKLGPNKSNTWQQQPKIKSMAARDKAYIKTAGLGSQITNKKDKDGKSKSKSKTKDPLNPDDDVINSPEYKFGRLLASPLARTRHSTVLKLREYLKARTNPNNENGGLSMLDLMKLWKGLWHTLYLCDGVAVQEEVSKLLASLLWSVGGTQEEDEYAGRFYLDLDEDAMEEDGQDDTSGEVAASDEVDGSEDEMQIIEMSDDEDEVDVNEDKNDEEGPDDEDEDITNPAQEEETKHCRGAHLSALYIRTYFRTLVREWSNMDKYRIDKFYTLTRFVVREIYRYMASRHWNLGIVRLFNDAIFEEVLRVQNYGNGVRFHLLDISLEELALVNSEAENGLPLTEATYLDCMEPYFALAQRVEEKTVHDRVMEKVLSRFLDEYSVVSDNYSSGDTSNKEDEAVQGKKKLVMDQVHVQTVAQFIFELASDKETQDRYRKQLYDMHKTYMKRIKVVGRDVDIVGDVDTVEDDDEEEGDNSGGTCAKKCACACEKKKLENEGKEEATTASDKTSIEEDKKAKKKKKKKDKKKKKKIEAKAIVEGKQKIDDDQDEVITISSKEQKAAAKAASKVEKKAKSPKKRASNAVSANDDTTQVSAKKVKFGKVNRSKSYKASMKDLENINAKAILERTPEKSILMPSKKKKSKKRSN